MSFFDINNILIHIPLGSEGYALSWIEATGTVLGVICIILASMEKTLNYLFGILNVTLFAIIFFQIQLYASLLLQLFFFVVNIYGWYIWGSQAASQKMLKVRWLSAKKTAIWSVICLMLITVTAFTIDTVFKLLTQLSVSALTKLGLQVNLPDLQPDPFPLADACMMVLSMAAMILMTRKYVENWLLWVAVNVISVVTFMQSGVYFMAVEYLLLTFIALNGSWRWMLTAKHNGSIPLS